MRNLNNIGRIFYGVSIAALGFQTMYNRDFPYMLIPPRHSGILELVILTYISGALLILAGASIVFEKGTRPISLLLGSVLLMIFCFYFIPYEIMATSNYMHLGEWDNAEKELALSSGAFIIAGCYSVKNENPFFRFLGKLVPSGTILFCITIISFGIDHFLYAKEVAEYIPSWVSYPMFWAYFAGVALLGSGIAILLKIKLRLAAILLGTMIFIWFIILHIPKVISAPAVQMSGEVTSAFLALAYSGIAFVIAGTHKTTIAYSLHQENIIANTF
jgi:uncharacterized membrane protein YphA (DoxX/SURF4 family)